METAYGDPDAVPPVDELRRFLRWARQTRKRNRPPKEEAPVGRLILLIILGLGVGMYFPASRAMPYGQGGAGPTPDARLERSSERLRKSSWRCSKTSKSKCACPPGASG